ncbi:MAG TPA: bifunctional serine/threonine-protein kinase/formylglycine-generating enzyme family protein [Kofleriaceae bacterium]|nr:bifunctional serine/threonine-protein kinase/formylglycine-generating enzyme family protein [Kofleriaceae bacterium]
MASRRPEGTALLVAGYGAFGTLDASGLHTLGQIGEALLATGAAWQIRRLAATAGAGYAPDRGALKQHLDELSAEPARAAVLVLLGTVVDVGGEPALVTSVRAREYPEDATLPLRWIRDRLRAARAEQLVAVVSALGEGNESATWLRALGTSRAQHLVAVAPSPDDTHAIVGTLLTALCGDALDPRTGTVTMSSLSAYLGRHPGAAVQASDTSETLAQPPPLAGLWDVRRSQLSMRATRPRMTGDGEDLTGMVLPGRFRIDSVVARGTFGTVYRARQLAVERDVAVKVLNPDIDPASEDGRLFVHEIRSVGRIDHANVVRIHQADITHDGRLFFAMELLDGHDLQEVGAAGPLPRARAVDLVCQLLAGLGAAHDAGLVHADVKPANAIVVERDGAERVVLVDFGLARLRAPDRPTESAGGTPAYMAPEQMHIGRIDARSDLFSAALVLVYLLTGWRRPNAFTPTPPFEIITDPALRAVLERALELEPSRRYATARELISALTGAAPPPPEIPPTPPAPFRQLAPLTEEDRGRLYGREADLAVITQHALYRRSVIYTAPSGTGKTSMLRAGLVPRLEALGVRAVYLRCRADSASALAGLIHPDGPAFADATTLRAHDLASLPGAPPGTSLSGASAAPAPSIAAAITGWHRQGGGKLVLVLDQVEAALGDDDFVRAVLGFAEWPADADVAVVLSIREDHLARLLARAQVIEPGIPVVRLPPLPPEGARAAIIGPLTEARLAIEPDLLDALLADLQRAAAAIGPEMGWGTDPAVFPPHLQLACSVLYEELAPGDATLTLAHYKRLGGFDAIVGEHLERVLDTELTDGSDKIARALFVALVTVTHERAMRAESELIAMVGDPERVTVVLEVLRSRGLLVRVRGDDGEPSWELAHDSLVPRVMAWMDSRDLDRRRAIELVRYHLRRSRADAPSLLGRAELRELKPHLSAIAELDAEWQRRATGEPWTPSRLVARSRQVVRREAGFIAVLFGIAAAVASISLYNSHAEAQRRDAELALKARNLGRFTLSLEPFDWDPVGGQITPVDAAPLGLRWQLLAAVEDEPGPPFIEHDEVERGSARLAGGKMVEDVEARGGRAFLSIERPGCTPSLLPLKELPGYAERERERPVFQILVPTCAATRAGMVEIPDGPFRYGGKGYPPAPGLDSYPDLLIEKPITLPHYWIDRTEVTNAAFGVLARMSASTGIGAPIYPRIPRLAHAADPRKPVTWINWFTARAFCRYLGKDLPTSEQWVKAMRGGEQLPDGSTNPIPNRNYPFGEGDPLEIAALDPDEKLGVADVGTHPRDRSPYGVLDLTGNVQEWTLSPADTPGIRILRGGGVEEGIHKEILFVMAIPNSRVAVQPLFAIGARCALNE